MKLARFPLIETKRFCISTAIIKLGFNGIGVVNKLPRTISKRALTYEWMSKKLLLLLKSIYCFPKLLSSIAFSAGNSLFILTNFTIQLFEAANERAADKTAVVDEKELVIVTFKRK